LTEEAVSTPRGEFVDRRADVVVRVAGCGDAPRNARGIWLWTKQQAETLAAKNTERKTPALTHVRLGRMAAAAARSPLRRMLGQRVRHSNAR